MDSETVKRQKVPLKASGPTPASPKILPDPRPANPSVENAIDSPIDVPDHDGTGNPTESTRPLLRSPDSSNLLSPEDPLDQTHGHKARVETETVKRQKVSLMTKKSLQEALSQDSDYEPLRRANTNTSTEYSVEEVNGLRRRRRNTFSDDEIRNIPRLVHRNLPFKQSRQEIAVVNKTIFKSMRMQRILRILSQDWFHIFLRQPTYQSLPALLCLWTFIIVIFAFIYQRIDRDDPHTECGLGPAGAPIKFAPAFAFSLETCTTVGYGLPNGTNGFFEPQCFGLQIAIYAQMTWSMCFNAFLFAFIFARLARCEARGAQVLFSDKAIIEIRDGKWMMHVRIYDYDAAKPLVEAHVRMYCVSWRDYERQTRDLVQPHLLHHMRILQPDDELGSQLYTSIPANVTHHVDAFSPLAPLKMRRKYQKSGNGGLPLREADQICGNRDGVMCPVCGETFGTTTSLKKHVNYLRLCEDNDGDFPVEGSHRDPTLIKPKIFKPFILTEDDIREQLKDKEIMVVIEAIEPMVSGTFQALQSYKLGDIVFGGRFEPCMSQQNGKIYVDVDKFHSILPPNENSLHRYSLYNGGYNHRMAPSLSYLPSFFRSPAPRPTDQHSNSNSPNPSLRMKTPSSFFGRPRARPQFQ